MTKLSSLILTFVALFAMGLTLTSCASKEAVPSEPYCERDFSKDNFSSIVGKKETLTFDDTLLIGRIYKQCELVSFMDAANFKGEEPQKLTYAEFLIANGAKSNPKIFADAVGKNNSMVEADFIEMIELFYAELPIK